MLDQNNINVSDEVLGGTIAKISFGKMDYIYCVENEILPI